MIEFSDKEGAERAKETFNNLPFRNSFVNVMISNSGPVSCEMSNELNKIYDNTNLNRFKETKKV